MLRCLVEDHGLEADLPGMETAGLNLGVGNGLADGVVRTELLNRAGAPRRRRLGRGGHHGAPTGLEARWLDFQARYSRHRALTPRLREGHSRTNLSAPLSLLH